MPTHMPCCNATRMTWRPMRTARTTRRISVESNTVSAAEAAAVKSLCAQCHANRGAGQRRGIVNTIAHHQDTLPLLLKFFDNTVPCPLASNVQSRGPYAQPYPSVRATTSPSPVSRIVSLIPARRKSAARSREGSWTRNVFENQQSLDLFLHRDEATNLTTLDPPLAFRRGGILGQESQGAA